MYLLKFVIDYFVFICSYQSNLFAPFNSSFSINPKKWKFKKNENGHESAEYTFQLKNGDLYGMAISEQVEIDVEELAKIAFDNARDAAPDTKIVKKEYRTVNGHKVIYMEMVGSIQSIKFKYLGYYYSNSSGSTQYLTYTSTNLVEKYKTEIDRFLNGFSITRLDSYMLHAYFDDLYY